MDAQRYRNMARDWPKGQRVQMAAHTDAFMQGDRYGVVLDVSAKRVRVQMDRSGKTRSVSPASLTHVTS
jgi:hypothetical protein